MSREQISIIGLYAVSGAFISIIWVALPFLFFDLNISLYLLGVIMGISILVGYLARIPSKFYVDMAGPDNAIVIGIMAMGISTSLVFLAKSFNIVLYSFILIFIFNSLFSVAIKEKTAAKFDGQDSLSKLSNISLVGSFAGFFIFSVFTTKEAPYIYGIISLIMIFSAVASMMILSPFKKTVVRKQLHFDIKDLVRKPLEVVESLSRMKNREFLIVVIVVEILIILSMSSVNVFIPALAIKDGLTLRPVFILFGILGTASFFLKYVGRMFGSGSFFKMFYVLRPGIIMVAMVFFSIAISSYLFVVGFAFMALVTLTERGFNSYQWNKFSLTDADKIRAAMAFFSVPMLIIAPLLGSLLWFASPRLLFGFAILPAIFALMITMFAQGYRSTVDSPKPMNQ
ncbi:hypothetical protein OXIME_001511 [Oxyplasma meridianum]|uniref:MFS transporter n=1 Tax=Oxyplasma meridianum TaxID=3073602 RepID=A0AAX4NJ78_9ARCH